MNTEEKAAALFRQGYGCAQAVLSAFCEQTGLEKEKALLLASSFGAGMGGLRETCGAVTGMFMVAGLLTGYGEAFTQEQKRDHYARIRRLADAFRQEHATLCCRELLAGLALRKDGEPEKRTEQYYKTRPCEQFVRTAVRLLQAELAPTGGCDD